MKGLRRVSPTILTEGELMGTGPINDLARDTVYALICSIVAISGLIYAGTPLIPLDNIDAINRTITTILGLLFPVLAIIYTFGFRDDNSAIMELKRIGKFDDIVSIFTISIASIGVVWIYTFSITVFEIYTLFGEYIQILFAYITTAAFIFVILRVWRCFQIFLLLEKAINANE